MVSWKPASPNLSIAAAATLGKKSRASEPAHQAHQSDREEEEARRSDRAHERAHRDAADDRAEDAARADDAEEPLRVARGVQARRDRPGLEDEEGRDHVGPDVERRVD